jgi:predicted aldo/keto reductase-like oxidoreductase
VSGTVSFQAQADGRIAHAGFSFHGLVRTLKKSLAPPAGEKGQVRFSPLQVTQWEEKGFKEEGS